MKKTLLLGMCLVGFSFGCQQKEPPRSQAKPQQNQQKMDDQNYQDRRRQMKSRSQGGCCGTDEVQSSQKSETAKASSVKVK